MKSMMKICTLLLLASATCGTASAQYQLPNAGFEEWEATSQKYGFSTVKGNEPVSWSSFSTMVSGGTLYNSAANAAQLYQSKDVKHSGESAAHVKAKKVLGSIVAQGNLTNGCIYGGSMTPTDAKGNYNFTNEAVEGQNTKFTGRPDAFRVWIKANTTYNFNISVLLHEKGYYQDPYYNQKGIVGLIAHAKLTPKATNTNWNLYEIPVEYDNAAPDARPYYVLVTFATSAVPGQASETDEMWVDDVEFVYNSELASATYNGTTINFHGTAATVDAAYDENLLALTSNGKGATIVKDFDAATGVLTIIVKGDNISEDTRNFHTYTIQFYDSITTGMNTAAATNEATSIYDLQGRQFNSVGQKGLFIVNGHKVIK